jgi:hypothetical protein
METLKYKGDSKTRDLRARMKGLILKAKQSGKRTLYQCSCGEFVDKSELRDVIFHESDHNLQVLVLPRMKGKLKNC